MFWFIRAVGDVMYANPGCGIFFADDGHVNDMPGRPFGRPATGRLSVKVAEANRRLDETLELLLHRERLRDRETLLDRRTSQDTVQPRFQVRVSD